MPLTSTDFARMWIVVPANLQERLEQGGLLVCSHEQVQFVLGYDYDKTQARRAEVEKVDHRPAYAVVIDPGQRAEIARGEIVFTYPVDGENSSPGTSTLRLSGVSQTENPLRTEHGRRQVQSVLLDDLRVGDFFAISERTEMYREWVVYRAVATTADGTVRAERTGPGYRKPETETVFAGRDQVVYRIADRQEMLGVLGWEDIPVAA